MTGTRSTGRHFDPDPIPGVLVINGLRVGSEPPPPMCELEEPSWATALIFRAQNFDCSKPIRRENALAHLSIDCVNLHTDRDCDGLTAQGPFEVLDGFLRVFIFDTCHVAVRTL